jgi:hypothetical protein
VLARAARDFGDPRDRGACVVARLGRIDPAERDPVATERLKLVRKRRELGLELIKTGVPAHGDEAEGVQPPTHLKGAVAVQVKKLDAVVSDLGDGPEHTLEIARTLVPNRVQHQGNTCH